MDFCICNIATLSLAALADDLQACSESHLQDRSSCKLAPKQALKSWLSRLLSRPLIAAFRVDGGFKDRKEALPLSVTHPVPQQPTPASGLETFNGSASTLSASQPRPSEAFVGPQRPPARVSLLQSPSPALRVETLPLLGSCAGSQASPSLLAGQRRALPIWSSHVLSSGPV